MIFCMDKQVVLIKSQALKTWLGPDHDQIVVQSQRESQREPEIPGPEPELDNKIPSCLKSPLKSPL